MKGSEEQRAKARTFSRSWYARNKARASATRKAHRAANLGLYAERYKTRRLKARAIIDAAKSMPCADCGLTFDPICMDLDHRPGETKVASVAKMPGDFTIEKILEEIAKCDVVCACCHRLRTKQRGGY